VVQPVLILKALHKIDEKLSASLFLALAGLLLGTAPKAAAFPATKESAQLI
jgi:hypothetical protein